MSPPQTAAGGGKQTGKPPGSISSIPPSTSIGDPGNPSDAEAKMQNRCKSLTTAPKKMNVKLPVGDGASKQNGRGRSCNGRSKHPFVFLFICWWAMSGVPISPMCAVGAGDATPGVRRVRDDSRAILVMPLARLDMRKERSDDVLCVVTAGADMANCDSDGLLVAGHLPGQAVVQISDVENGQRVTYTRHIEIAKATKLKLSEPGALPGNPMLAYTPVGLTLRLQVSYSDSSERLFEAVSGNLELRNSRADVAEASLSGENSNRTLTVRCVRVGTTVIQVFDVDKPELTNHIKIRVDSAIVPSVYDVQVGELTCFRCGLLTPDGRQGLWTSSAPGVLHVDKKSGVSVAVSEGSATVFYSLSDGVATEALITVRPLRTLLLGTPTVENLSSSSQSARPLEFALPVTFGRGRSETCDGSQFRDLAKVKREVWSGALIGLFSCSIGSDSVHSSGTTADDVLIVRPDVDEAGDFICRVVPKAGRQSGGEADRGFVADLVITATDKFGHTATATVEHVPHREFPFHPPVSETPVGKVDTWFIIFRSFMVGGILIGVILWSKCRFAYAAGPPGLVQGYGVPQPAAFAIAIATKHRQQDAKDKSQTVDDLVNINQKSKANDAKAVTATENSNQKEFDETEAIIDASLDKTVREASRIILHSLLKNEERVATLSKLDKDRKGSKTISVNKLAMVMERQNQSAKENLKTRITKHMERKAKDYTAARAQLELDKLNENSRYIPLLPPGKDWTKRPGQDIWIKILCRFVVIIAHHIGKREAWPKQFTKKEIHWAADLRDPMKDLLLPFYEKYVDDIINLGGANLEKKSEFGEAMLQTTNKTFIKHFDEEKASTYYVPFYAGTIHLLHILKEMEVAETEQEPQPVENEPEIIHQDPEEAVKWTPELLWQRMGDKFAAEFQKDEYEKVRPGVARIFGGLAHALGTAADVGGAAAGQQEELNEPPASTGRLNGNCVRRRGPK